MRIVSLLPSATEIVYALGLGDDLVGVTYECDYPPEATSKPVVVKSALPQGRPLSSREIDEEVRDRMDRQEPIYVLEKELIQQLEPDVILTQDLCRVCAVPSGQVQEALEEIGVRDAKVLSLDPHTFDQVLEGIRAVGTTLGRAERADEIVGALRARVEAVRAKAVRLPSIRVLCQEWLDPPFAAGHWVPDMVETVGGVNLLTEKELPSRVVTWREIRDASSTATPNSSRPRRLARGRYSPSTRPPSSPAPGRGSSMAWRSWRGPCIPRPSPSRRTDRSPASSRKRGPVSSRR
jgi:iron complex transport system substrate-binding protein